MPRTRSRLLPVVILFACLAASLGGWQLAEDYTEVDANAHLLTDAARIETELQERMAAYTQVLHGGAALFAASETVAREDWHDYFEALDLHSHFPGFQAFGFVERVHPGDVAAHEEAVRAEGFPDYRLHPPGVRVEYSAIVYIEPFDEQNQRAFGYDMYSQLTPREAMARARDTGEAAVTGGVMLVQDDLTGDTETSFILYVPVYAKDAPTSSVAERRAALQGWVYAPFRTVDFISGLRATPDADVALRIYDGRRVDEANLLYASAERPVGSLQRVVSLPFAGRTWTLVEQPTLAALSPGVTLLPAAVLVGGFIASGLLFGISFALVTTRERANVLAQTMTAQLRTRTDELEATNQALRQFNYVVTHDLKEPVRGIDVSLAVLHDDHTAQLDDHARSLLASARQASARLTRLLAALLELSRADRAQLRTASVDPREVLRGEQCRAAFETLERERGARVELGEMPRVLAAPSVLAQALGNLVGNAIRHNPRPTPRVLVHGRRAGRDVEILVEDDGRGFSRELRAAFETSQPTGMGFGILLARQSVERMGGRMTLGTSPRLGGALVRLTLPAASPPSSAPGNDAAGRPRTRGSSSASR